MSFLIDKTKIILLLIVMFIVDQFTLIIVSGKLISFSTFPGEVFWEWFIPLILLGFVFWWFIHENRSRHLATFKLDFLNWRNLGLILGGYAAIVVINIIGGIVMRMSGETITRNQSGLEQMFQHTPAFLLILVIGIVGPVMEETMFRSVIPKLLFKKHYKWGLVVGTILFGLAHGPTNIGSAMMYLGMGAVFSYIRYRSDRLEVSISTHMLNNFIAVLVMLTLM